MNGRRRIFVFALLVALLAVGVRFFLRERTARAPELDRVLDGQDVEDTRPVDTSGKLISGVPDELRARRLPPQRDAPNRAQKTTERLMGLLRKEQQPPSQALPEKKLLEELGLHEESPPGMLIGAVFDGAEPFDDGVALVWHHGKGFGADGIPVGRNPAARGSIGNDGIFRFDNLKPGRYYVGVRPHGGVAHLVFRMHHVGPHPTKKVIVILGTSRLFGTVYNDEGEPAADISVRASIASTGAGSHTAIAQVRTDEDGTYSFDRLRAGGGWLSVAYSGNFNDDGATPSRQYSLRPGQERREDFGSPNGFQLLRGRIVTMGGEHIRGPGKIVISDGTGSGYVVSRYDESGTFSQRLALGEYRFRVMFPDPIRQPTSAGNFDVSVKEVDTDTTITIPGARITGRVTFSAGRTRRIADSVSWRTRKGASARASGSARIRSNGVYFIDGLFPATYVLRAPDGEQDIEVTIRKGDFRVVQDLDARN